MARYRTTTERTRSLPLLVTFVFCSAAVAAAHAQPLPTIRVGTVASNLDGVTGVWEQRVAPDTIAGLSLKVMTKVPPGSATLRSAAIQTVRFVAVTTYLRKNGVSAQNGVSPANGKPEGFVVCCAYRNGTATAWYSDGPGDFALENGRLQLHQTNQFSVTLDLVYDPAIDGWRGRYESPYFKGNVALQRPHMPITGAPVGTWLTYSDRVIERPGTEKLDVGCLHIGVGDDTQLVLWSDYHSVRVGWSDARTPPLDESYGEFLNDTLTTRSGDQWTFYYGDGMWREKVTGKLSADGSEFSGFITDHEGNGVYPIVPRPEPFVWRRLRADRCEP